MRWFMTLFVVIAALGLAAVAGAEQSYTDGTGDSSSAPDLTQVTVGNDASQVTLKVAVAMRTPADDEAYVIFINTDGNPATGKEGDEVLVVMAGSSGVVETWSGSAWVDAPNTGYNIRLELNASSLTWSVAIQRSILGTTTTFSFVVASLKLSGDDVVASDFSPNGGSWQYTLTFKQCSNGRDDDGDGKVDSADLGCSNSEDDLESDDPYTLAIGRPTVTPASGRAGKPIVVKTRVTQVETSQPIATGSVGCTMKVGGATKRSAGQFAGGGTATCRLTSPKVAKPTTIRGTITVTSKSKSISAPFSFRAK